MNQSNLFNLWYIIGSYIHFNFVYQQYIWFIINYYKFLKNFIYIIKKSIIYNMNIFVEKINKKIFVLYVILKFEI